MNKNIIENIFSAIGEMIIVSSISFSRDSLSSKLRQIDSIGNREFNRSFKRCLDSSYFKRCASGDKAAYRLTQKGYAKLIGYRFREMTKRNKKEWDGIWRLVIFDIPEDKKFARNLLRKKFHYCGFFPLQKSVFVFPFECKNEIKSLGEFFQIEDSLLVMEAKSLGSKEDEAKIFFNLEN